MTKLQETLSILDFFFSRIQGKANFLKKFSGKTLEEIVYNEFNKNANRSLDEKDINKISRVSADLLIQIHTYLCINIIDINSLYDEYTSYFNISCTDIEIEKIKINKG